MRQNPFRHAVRELHGRYTYSQICERAGWTRKESWWNNLVLYGPWGDGPRMFPPDPYAFEGMAALFGVTQQELCEMIAADWYGVYPPPGVSERVQRMQKAINDLTAEDATMVEAMIRRLAYGGGAGAQAA
jgi:hypothetical protein